MEEIASPGRALLRVVYRGFGTKPRLLADDIRKLSGVLILRDVSPKYLVVEVTKAGYELLEALLKEEIAAAIKEGHRVSLNLELHTLR